jgi:hypothetical protein
MGSTNCEAPISDFTAVIDHRFFAVEMPSISGLLAVRPGLDQQADLVRCQGNRFCRELPGPLRLTSRMAL